MSWLELAGWAVAAAALWWGWRARQALRRETAYLAQRAGPPPPAEPFSPLFCTLSEALDAGVIVVSQARMVRYCNATAANLFGIPADDVLNHGVITLLRDYQADTMIEQAIRLRDPQQMTLRPTLSNRTIRIWCEPLADGDHGALLIARDLTQLNQLERARRDLVANVSHELRTPLASLKLLVETLDTSPPPDLGRRMLGQMDSELDAVMQLVDELHELSQIESGRLVLQMRRTPPADVVERALARIQPQAGRKSIDLSATIPADLPALLIDPDRISQVLLNLLHNAVKWTDAGGRIAVTASMRPRESLAHHLRPELAANAAWVAISIQDTGAGIPAEALPRIFERFFKVDRARTRGAGGTGLGLAIVKHLVEGHGGAVWAASTEGQGSTFTVALPAAE